MRDLAPHQSNQNHFYSTQQDKKEDAHVKWFTFNLVFLQKDFNSIEISFQGSTFRRIMLAFYILLVAGFAAAVIATMVTGPWSKQ